MSASTSDGEAATVSRKTPPGPRGRLLTGSMNDFRRDNLRFIRNVAMRYGDVVRYRMANMTCRTGRCRPRRWQRCAREVACR